MPWTTPRTWTPGELVTALMLNQHLRDNLNAIISGSVGFSSLTVEGGQIAFPGTQIPSSNANVLDDYEESNFTPTDGSGAGLTFVVAQGNFVKIGSLVVAVVDATYPATADATSARINMPFQSAGTGINAYGGAMGYTDRGVALQPYLAASTDDCFFYDPAGVQQTNAQLSGKTVRFSIAYRAAA